LRSPSAYSPEADILGDQSGAISLLKAIHRPIAEPLASPQHVIRFVQFGAGEYLVTKSTRQISPHLSLRVSSDLPNDHSNFFRILRDQGFASA
jgi:hypothetical protein